MKKLNNNNKLDFNENYNNYSFIKNKFICINSFVENMNNLLIVLVILIYLYSNTAYSQSKFQTLGSSQIYLSNYGLNLITPETIEYDNFTSLFHTSNLRKEIGVLKIFNQGSTPIRTPIATNTVSVSANKQSSNNNSLLVNVIDTDSDRISDTIDSDDDNDGILDSDECQINTFNWSTAPVISGNVAKGTIGGTNYTYTSSSPITSTTDVFDYSIFPTSYLIPNRNPTIQNINATNNTINFNSPVLNPVLVFSSIGRLDLSVPIKFSNPFEILFSKNIVVNSPTEITGNEGFLIIRFLGVFSTISFNYTVDEFYCNFVFGASIISNCDTDGDGLTDNLDLDSDNDGCFDANEAYNSSVADSNRDGTYGGTVGTYPTGVDVSGKVITASYGYTNADVANTRKASKIIIDTQPTDKCIIVNGNTTINSTATEYSTSAFALGVPSYNFPPATSTSSSLNFQWQVSADSGSTWITINSTTHSSIYTNFTTENLKIANAPLSINGYLYRLIVTHKFNICLKIISNSAKLSVLTAPILGAVSQPTCTFANGTVALSGLPTTGSWTVSISPTVMGATGTTGSGTTTTIGDLPPGSYTFAVTNSLGCISTYTTSAIIYTQPSIPIITSTPANCSSPEISIVSNYSSSNSYTFTPIGPLLGVGGKITGMIPSNSYTLTSSNGNCSTVSIAFSNDPQLTIPAAPKASVTNQPGCIVPTGIITVSSPLPGLGNTYTLVGINPVVSPITNATGIFTGLAIGLYQVTTTNSFGCTSLPISGLSISDYFCPSPAIALIKKAIAIDESGNGLSTDGETIMYNFILKNTGNVPLINITISDPLTGLMLKGAPISLLPSQEDSTSFVGYYTITKKDTENGSVINQATASGTSNLGIIVKDLSDSVSFTKDGNTIVPVEKTCEIKVSNVVTPNNDGFNEFLYIDGIECYPENNLKIFNRWGVVVFDAIKYDNINHVFKGISEGRLTVNQSVNLPSGTYFYAFKYIDIEGRGINKSGYLYLNGQ